jgi:chaperone required for assembly of F1-ATPase
MRDIFDDIYRHNPLDPEEAARRNMRVDLRKRFYEKVSVDGTEGAFGILLDGKPVRTPARRILAAPARALAQAIADEWDAQKDVIDPGKMPLTRLANSIIDGVIDAPGPVAEEIENYLGSDLLFYRADGPEGLTQAQEKHWDPVVAWARDELGARFILAEGVVFAPQPEEAIAAARAAIPAQHPWALGAVHAVTTLTGSALLALALAAGRLDVDSAWAAAHVDEDWNLATWGRDEVVLARRTLRFAEMQAAAQVLKFAAS